MISSEQLRAARALTRIEQADLAEISGVSLATIKRLEAATGPIAATTTTEAALRTALGEAGIIFIDENGEGPGVRLKKGGHPMQIKSRIDLAMEYARATGIVLLGIQLTIVEGTIFARSLGLEQPPNTYAGVSVTINPKAPQSTLQGHRPNDGGGVRIRI